MASANRALDEIELQAAGQREVLADAGMASEPVARRRALVRTGVVQDGLQIEMSAGRQRALSALTQTATFQGATRSATELIGRMSAADSRDRRQRTLNTGVAGPASFHRCEERLGPFTGS